MTLVSVQVGRPRAVHWRGKIVTTGIYKEPVVGRLMLRTHNLEGDEQADLSVHGGPDKAVYVYPAGHYAYWREQLPTMTLTFGSFGENFTIDGLDESSVRIGDRFRIGNALVTVTQPRLPCYKLGLRFNDLEMPKRFHASGRCGFYLAVQEEGDVGGGDRVTAVARNERGPSVIEAYRQRVE